MNALIIGADGFIGSNLFRCLPACGHSVIGTTRKGTPGLANYDLLKPGDLPAAEVAYLCAAVNGFRPCEGNREAYRTNVDGTIETARRLVAAGTFVVFLSSDSVEWIDSAYSRQKALVEVALQLLGGSAIVRAGRVTKFSVGQLVRSLMSIGAARVPGVYHWDA
jgi:nucleoside-diphosphate-sugar epimerase